MSIFYGSTYTFNINSSNYINAITKYNKNVFITAINGVSCDVTCDQLPVILKQLGASVITIECRSANSYATSGIFPKLDDVFKDATVIERMGKISDAQRATAHSRAELIIRGINNWSREDGPRMMLPPLESLTIDQAYIVLSEIHKKIPTIDGVFHFPNQQKILINNNGHNIIFTYGDNTRIYPITPFTFDIDDGFFCKDKIDSEYQLMINQLNKYFEYWKNNNYEGEIVPRFISDLTPTHADEVRNNTGIMQLFYNSVRGLFYHEFDTADQALAYQTSNNTSLSTNIEQTKTNDAIPANLHPSAELIEASEARQNVPIFYDEEDFHVEDDDHIYMPISKIKR